MAIGVGMIGCGVIARAHAFGIMSVLHNRLLDVALVAVCDSDRARAEAFARGMDVPVVSSDPAAVIEDPAVDAVYVCTPTVTHGDLVAAAAAAGKAIFCEKPLAFSTRDAQQMADAVNRSGVPAQVGLVLRYSPTMLCMRRRLHEGADGRLMAVVFRDDQFFPITGHYASTWRADRAIAGGGVLLEHSIHDVDVLTWMCGPVTSVSALTRNFAGHEGIEDLGVVTLEFASGAVSTLTSLWHSITTRPSTRRLEVFCENAMLMTEHDMVGPVVIAESSGDTTISDDDVMNAACLESGAPDSLKNPAMPYCLENWAFLSAIEECRPPAPGFDAAVEAHRILDAVYESASSGGVRVELRR